MSSESDIRKMLIDALRPSIQQAVQAELAALGDIRAEFVTAASVMRREIDELRRMITEEIADRTGLIVKDLQRHLDQETDAKLSSVRSQLVVSAAERHALRDDIAQGLARLTQRIDALDQRLRTAAAALREELSQQPAGQEGLV
ncbi:MAG: hypothetical protein ACLQJR_10270 [Stellaceae bacterium]